MAHFLTIVFINHKEAAPADAAEALMRPYFAEAAASAVGALDATRLTDR